MVRPNLRGRSIKKSQRKTPGGKTVTHFRAKKASAATDPRTGKKLHGVAIKRAAKAGALPASQRKISRPYGGHLGADTVDALIRYAARQNAKISNPELSNLPLHRDLSLEKYLPPGWKEKNVRSPSKWSPPKKKEGSTEEKPKKPTEKTQAKKEKPAAKTKRAMKGEKKAAKKKSEK
ncbi:50S ribosomal protein L34e [uncultured archaeon]|nr:50S ribosomal protein L34e [uncultured archaeon]